MRLAFILAACTLANPFVWQRLVEKWQKNWTKQSGNLSYRSKNWRPTSPLVMSTILKVKITNAQLLLSKTTWFEKLKKNLSQKIHMSERTDELNRKVIVSTTRHWGCGGGWLWDAMLQSRDGYTNCCTTQKSASFKFPFRRPRGLLMNVDAVYLKGTA
jgi:hypothetical protein